MDCRKPKNKEGGLQKAFDDHPHGVYLRDDAVNGLLASFVMPEEQQATIKPILTLVNALGLKAIPVENGA